MKHRQTVGFKASKEICENVIELRAHGDWRQISERFCPQYVQMFSGASVLWVLERDGCGVCLIILPAVKKSDLAIQLGGPPEGHNDWIKGGV